MTIGADNIELIGRGNGDGTVLGQSTTELVSLYGVTPIAQRSGSAQASTAITSTLASSTSARYAFTSSTQPAAMITLANELRASLVAIGLMKGSA